MITKEWLKEMRHKYACQIPSSDVNRIISEMENSLEENTRLRNALEHLKREVGLADKVACEGRHITISLILSSALCESERMERGLD